MGRAHAPHERSHHHRPVISNNCDKQQVVGDETKDV
jgi:hypothetical protein